MTPPKDRGANTRTNDKRERILEAAVKVFAELGFYNAKVSQVAREAGVADGTIYLYFKNKDDLLISAFEDRMHWINERLRQELGVGGKTPPERLRQFFLMHLLLSVESRSLAEFITVELRQSAKFIKEYENPQFAVYLGILSSLIKEGQEQGYFRRDIDARLVTRGLFGMLDEVTLTLVLSRKGPTVEQVHHHVEQLEKFVLGGLREEAPARAPEN